MMTKKNFAYILTYFFRTNSQERVAEPKSMCIPRPVIPIAMIFLKHKSDDNPSMFNPQWSPWLWSFFYVWAHAKLSLIYLASAHFSSLIFPYSTTHSLDFSHSKLLTVVHLFRVRTHLLVVFFFLNLIFFLPRMFHLLPTQIKTYLRSCFCQGTYSLLSALGKPLMDTLQVSLYSTYPSCSDSLFGLLLCPVFQTISFWRTKTVSYSFCLWHKKLVLNKCQQTNE